MKITAMILTFNEEANIRRTLGQLTWVDDIVVIDSGSTDETLAILRGYEQVRIFFRKFDSFAAQCNFGLQQIKTEWVLSLDADYFLTKNFVVELQGMIEPSSVVGYQARFTYCIYGHPLRASLYPPRTVLYRRSLASYRDDGHAHRVTVDGDVAMLDGHIEHDDRKPLSRWFSSQNIYTKQEAEKLWSLPASVLNLQDRLRRTMVLGPILVFFYTLLVRRAVLDGWAGWFYTFQRTLAEIMLSLRLLERKLSPAPVPPTSAALFPSSKPNP